MLVFLQIRSTCCRHAVITLPPKCRACRSTFPKKNDIFPTFSLDSAPLPCYSFPSVFHFAMLRERKEGFLCIRPQVLMTNSPSPHHHDNNPSPSHASSPGLTAGTKQSRPAPQPLPQLLARSRILPTHQHQRPVTR